MGTMGRGFNTDLFPDTTSFPQLPSTPDKLEWSASLEMVPISDPLQRPSALLVQLSQLQQSICPIRLFTRPSSFKSAQQRRPARKVPRQRPSPSRRLMPVARKRSRLQLFHTTSPPPSRSAMLVLGSQP